MIVDEEIQPMPLRDHFRSPLDDTHHWEGFHATWPVMIVARLRHLLPPGYLAEPRVHLGTFAEIDVTTYERDRVQTAAPANETGGVATAVWTPTKPRLSVVTELPKQDIYEVCVYDEKRHCRLVAAVEIVSPRNKDRPESRRAFVSKCAGLLQEQVSVVIIDVVTTRTPNLYLDLLDHIGHSDPSANGSSLPLYVASCRVMFADQEWRFETWAESLPMGEKLPTLPLWLTETVAVPLELEESYEQSCGILGIP
jgi:hypothetical protein